MVLKPNRVFAVFTLIASVLPSALFSGVVQAKDSWSGNFTLTIKGSGRNEYAVKGVPGGKSLVTWQVDRKARGRIVLDRMFKGGGIAGTPDTRNTERYETWIADSAQPLEFEASDSGTYFGFIGPKRVALDEIHYQCPVPDERHLSGQVRSGILQFDRLKGTYTFETPRMIHRCATSHLRTPKHGPPEWMAKAPFNILANSHELQFDVRHGLSLPEDWRFIGGPYTDGMTELVLSRKIVFDWPNPFLDAAHRAPIEAELQLVLRRSP